MRPGPKRDGRPLHRDDIHAFVRGATDGSWPDYQVAAMLMAIVLRGMSAEEAAEYRLVDKVIEHMTIVPQTRKNED